MKKIIFLIFLILIFGVFWVMRKDLYRYYLEAFEYQKGSINISEPNSYYRNEDFYFVKQTTSFIPTNKDDIISIYYTVINSGLDKAIFYCPIAYSNCLSDVKDIANDQVILSHINNFVHPFNGFKNIETEYDSYGKVNIRIEHTYSEEQISSIIEQKNAIEKVIWTSSMSTQDKIMAAHDYIIQHTSYDTQRAQNQIITYQSDTAYGALIQGFALCGGYTDAMALFLEDLGLKNFKVSSENHIWNAVLLNNMWYHLDLTWDDPIMSDGSERLEHKFFLITTRELSLQNDKDHLYQKGIYQELS